MHFHEGIQSLCFALVMCSEVTKMLMMMMMIAVIGEIGGRLIPPTLTGFKLTREEGFLFLSLPLSFPFLFSGISCAGDNTTKGC